MNTFQTVFEQQKRHFASGVTRTYQWRVEQLDRMARLVGENETALQQAIAKDFKTASQEQVFETLACLGEVEFQKSQLKDWMAPIEAPVPKALAATGHRGVIYRDPYGVALIVAGAAEVWRQGDRPCSSGLDGQAVVEARAAASGVERHGHSTVETVDRA